MRRTATGIFLLATLAVSACGLPAVAEEYKLTPQELYDACWSIVKERYYDSTFNGQNWDRWKGKFDGKLNGFNQAYLAIDEMLSSLGSNSSKLYTKKDESESQQDMAQKWCGIGVAVNPDGQIGEVIAGSPADKAGLYSGDKICAIDNHDVSGLGGGEITGKLRGAESTTVNVSVTRSGRAMNFSIVRRSIAVPSLTTCTLPGNYGYIRLVTLGANDLPAELKEAISKLNSTRGLIIDVRGNPGGLLANAVDIADLFVSSGKICSTTSREGIVNYDAKGSCIYKKPIALLVDSDTSSGAEILAAALQDLGHAEVVGTKTAGEGLGQVVIPVDDDHTLHLALFQQLTSSGQPINRLGVTPSYLSAISPPEQLMGIGPWWTCNDKHFSAPGGGHDVQLLKAIRVLDKATGAASASQEQQDDDNKIKQEILATLKPLAPSASPPLTGPERPIGDKWALVIGISKFKNPEIDLKFPAKDAKDFAGYLVSNANFAADHVKVLTDEQATREAILDSLADHWLPRLAKKDDLVVIYFSTHGSASDMDIGGVNYVVAHDTNPESLLATGIAMEDLVRIIKKRIESDRVLVILDACHSGGASADAKDLSRPGNADADAIAQGTGQLVICSSKSNQRSWESTEYPNSVFTRCLIKSLRKNGEATTLGEAFQSLEEMVHDEVQRDRGQQQTPVLKSRWEGSALRMSVPPSRPHAALVQ